MFDVFSLCLVFGVLLLVTLCVIFFLRKRIEVLVSKEGDLRYENQTLRIEFEQLKVRHETTQKGSEEKVDLLLKTKLQLEESLNSLCYGALEKNSRAFLDLAKGSLETLQAQTTQEFKHKEENIREALNPIKELLSKFDIKVGEMEKNHLSIYSALKQQLTSVVQAEHKLTQVTGELSQALRSPNVRGNWGELQLRRVVELAGMVRHCDFMEQETVGIDGTTFRPDMVIRLPGEKVIVVDAKTPLEAYLEGIAAQDQGAQQKLFTQHAKHVRLHMDDLSKKGYWQGFENSCEFVVLFLPGEMFFSAALQYDPGLIEYGAAKGVLLATPTTLIALLRSVAFGWKQESISQHATQISQVGYELYKRLGDLNSHWNRLGKLLSGTVKAYNQATSTLDARVFPSARKFEKLEGGVRAKTHLEPLLPLEDAVRSSIAPEFQEGGVFSDSSLVEDLSP